MKKSTLALAAALMLGFGLPASAVTSLTNNFNVAITLTSKCEIVAPAPSDITLTYTSFQATTSTGSTNLNFRCTNTFPIASITLDSSSITDSVTNLPYTMTLGTVPTAGTGSTQTVSITATIASGLAGTCNAASCTNTAATNRQRTITLTY